MKNNTVSSRKKR